jgi:predicted Co/Zn/Cd cation transporter (cation efflux family)
MTLLTLKVAKLVVRPSVRRFHFGHTATKPTLSLFKSLIVSVTCVFAVFVTIYRQLEKFDAVTNKLSSIGIPQL